MTYGHLRADCLYTGISSGPNARYRVWESLYLYLVTMLPYWSTLNLSWDKFVCYTSIRIDREFCPFLPRSLPLPPSAFHLSLRWHTKFHPNVLIVSDNGGQKTTILCTFWHSGDSCTDLPFTDEDQIWSAKRNTAEENSSIFSLIEMR